MAATVGLVLAGPKPFNQGTQVWELKLPHSKECDGSYDSHFQLANCSRRAILSGSEGEAFGWLAW